MGALDSTVSLFNFSGKLYDPTFLWVRRGYWGIDYDKSGGKSA